MNFEPLRDAHPSSASPTQLAMPPRPTEDRANRAATLRWLRILMAAALAIPVLLFAVASVISYRDTFALADERIDRSIDVTQEQALKILQSVNLTIAAIQGLLDGRSDDDIRQNEALIRDRLAALLKALPEAQSIWLFDATGRPLVATSVFPAPASIDYSQEDYVRAPLEGYQGTYVGSIRDSQFGGQTFFPVSQARTSGGAIRGVIEVSLRPRAFGRFLFAHRHRARRPIRVVSYGRDDARALSPAAAAGDQARREQRFQTNHCGEPGGRLLHRRFGSRRDQTPFRRASPAGLSAVLECRDKYSGDLSRVDRGNGAAFDLWHPGDTVSVLFRRHRTATDASAL